METTMWALGCLSPLEIPMAGVLAGSLGFWAFCQVWRYLSLTKAPSRLTDGPENKWSKMLVQHAFPLLRCRSEGYLFQPLRSVDKVSNAAQNTATCR